MNYIIGAFFSTIMLSAVLLTVRRTNTPYGVRDETEQERFKLGDWVVWLWGRYSKWTVQVHVMLDRGLREYRVVRREMRVEMRCREAGD